MVRLLRKSRANKSQPRHPKSTEKPQREKEQQPAPETDGPRNFYKEDQDQNSKEHAARAHVTTVATPPD